MVLILNVVLKGCVRGYGNYEELTSSGVDPTELFDDIEDYGKSPDLVQPDIVIEECDDVLEEADNQQDINSPDHIQLLPIENARRRFRSKHTDRNVGPNFELSSLSEEDSLFTAPSLFSLVSSHDNLDSISGTKKVPKISLTKVSSFFIIIIRSMWYQRKKELMELFQTKRTSDISKKGEILY